MTTRTGNAAALSPFQQFVRSESFGGFLLIASAALAMIAANSALGPAYFSWKETYCGLQFGEWALKKPLELWVNDGLMALFFLLVGLEIKRELISGELSRPRDAALSVFAALGGMVVPALIYTAFNWGGPGLPGWGIPMATDIAFAIGVLSLAGSRAPVSLKIFLTALAIVDDLGAVAVIALFYTESLAMVKLLLSVAILIFPFLYGRMGGTRLWVYLLFGAVSWYFMLKSGVHATVAGVFLAMTLPISRKLDEPAATRKLRHALDRSDFEEREADFEEIEHVVAQAQSPLHRLEHALHPLSAYFIMPVFAFINAGVALNAESLGANPITLGALFGLVFGKPLGVFAFAWLSVKAGLAALPSGVNWKQIFSVGVLAGIGFTMSFFIAGLGFKEPLMLDQAKIGILAASVIAAVAGLVGIFLTGKAAPEQREA